MNPTTVTLRGLRKFGACESQRALFVKTFPHGARITQANVYKAFRVGLDVDWMLYRLTMHKVNAFDVGKLHGREWECYMFCRVAEPIVARSLARKVMKAWRKCNALP